MHDKGESTRRSLTNQYDYRRYASSYVHGKHTTVHVCRGNCVFPPLIARFPPAPRTYVPRQLRSLRTAIPEK